MKLKASFKEIARLPIRVVCSTNKIDDIDREMQQFRPDVVIVNYIQLMRCAAHATLNKEQEITKIIETLKFWGKRRGSVMIILSQVSREAGQRRQILKDLKESGSLEQQATTVAIIYRPLCLGKSKDEAEAELDMAKNQNGNTGRIKLVFDVKRLMFGEKDEYAND